MKIGFLILTLIMIAISFFPTKHERTDCDTKGGVLVRGTWSMVCIKAERL